MAASFSDAFSEVERDRLDQICGLEGPTWTPEATEPEVEAAFAGTGGDFYRSMAAGLVRRTGRRFPDAEDAIQEVLVELYAERRELFRRPPQTWSGLLFELARFRLISGPVGPSLQPLGELAAELTEPGIDHASQEAASASSISLPRDLRHLDREQMLEAARRFRDHHGRRPKLKECRPANRLPSAAEIRREFGSFRRLLIRAGMADDCFRHHQGRWEPREAAVVCRSFRIRHGYWPSSNDIKRFPGELPSSSTMVRLFGSTRAGLVQRGAEAILGTL